MFYSDIIQSDSILTFVFLYDRSTMTYYTMTMPVPYEIDNTNGETTVTTVRKLNSHFKQVIETMSSYFDIGCSYNNIVTTFAVGFNVKNKKWPELSLGYGCFYKSIRKFELDNNVDDDGDDDDEDDDEEKSIETRSVVAEDAENSDQEDQGL